MAGTGPLPTPQTQQGHTGSASYDDSGASRLRKGKKSVLSSYLGKEGLIDLHSFVRPLQQHLLAASPAVPDGWVGVGDAPEKHRSLIVKLLLGFPNALVDRHYRIVQICGDRSNNPDEVRPRSTLRREARASPRIQASRKTEAIQL